MLTRVFFTLALTFALVGAAVVRSDGCQQQFCSACPRQDNRGHPLQAEVPDAAYVHCQYQSSDCFYGPRSAVCFF